MIVDDVVVSSVADLVGILPGDHLFEVDGQPASAVGTYLTGHTRFRFHSPRSGQETALSTTGVPLGLEVVRSPASIEAIFDPEEEDLDSLYELWLQGEWQLLGQLSQRSLSKLQSIVQKLLGSYDSPLLVLRGAAYFEAGRRKRAAALFREYSEEYASHWTLNYSGMVDYYAARQLADRGQKTAAISKARAAHASCQVARTADLVQELSGRRPPLAQKRWLGNQFPLNYRLPVIDSSGRVLQDLASLGSVLGEMPAESLFLVCVLASYRGNGPYDDFMQRFRDYAKFFPEQLHGLHVLTTNPARPKEYPHFFVAEDECAQAGLPLRVLLDGGQVVAELKPSGSPTVYALDRRGTIVEEGALDEVDWWRALGRLPTADGVAQNKPASEDESPSARRPRVTKRRWKRPASEASGYVKAAGIGATIFLILGFLYCRAVLDPTASSYRNVFPQPALMSATETWGDVTSMGGGLMIVYALGGAFVGALVGFDRRRATGILPGLLLGSVLAGTFGFVAGASLSCLFGAAGALGGFWPAASLGVVAFGLLFAPVVPFFVGARDVVLGFATSSLSSVFSKESGGFTASFATFVAGTARKLPALMVRGGRTGTFLGLVSGLLLSEESRNAVPDPAAVATVLPFAFAFYGLVSLPLLRLHKRLQEEFW